jgi:hypothetical protein
VSILTGQAVSVLARLPGHPIPCVSVGVLIALAAGLLAGCGGTEADDPAPTTQAKPGPAPAAESQIGEGGKRMSCEKGFIGSGSADWREDAASIGPVGLVGSGRDFSKMTRDRSDGLFHTKTPMIVEGHEAVELIVPPGQRTRVALDVDRGGPYRQLTFTPCDEKPRTIWAAGLVLRDREPVVLEARWARQSARITVGETAP